MSDIRALMQVMEEQNKLLVSLMEAGIAERDSIVLLDAAMLGESILRKEQLGAALRELEEKREELAAGKTWRELGQGAEENDRPALRALRDDLKKNAREAQALSRANTVLYRQNMALLAQLMRIMPGPPEHSYDQSGSVPKKAPSGNFISFSA